MKQNIKHICKFIFLGFVLFPFEILSQGSIKFHLKKNEDYYNGSLCTWFCAFDFTISKKKSTQIK